ncbi:PTS system trehalose-specific EIIBC component [Priestia megaterium]|uniref:PTS system trehalose-specific EIIBC component n=1 Tax=Priestia megaterium TaxID=1404 RepID=UPI001C527231|nr:PTS system trehalose-specific EIIBC component [Priestia megaterium]MBW0933502.1 PTS system trehalose-specific EIIBC component [Priestia megaterium]
MKVDKHSVSQIIDALGGKKNISAATHCITRLRLVLKDENKVNQESLNNHNLVKGFFLTNGQFQVVIGQGTVDKVYKEMISITGIGELSKEELKNEAAKNLNPIQRAIKTLSDIFIPILPAIVTAGLLMGISNTLTGSGIFYDDKSFVDVHTKWKDLASIINLIANTAFVFLPGLIGWSAVNRFGGSPLLGIILGLMLVHPDLLNAWSYGEALAKGKIDTWNLFGFHVEKVGYQGQVLPILVASILLSRIEIFLRKRVPDGFQILVVAPVALLITGLLAFTVIGPITFSIGNVITGTIVWLFNTAPIIGGLVYGGLYAPLVITGMQHTFLAVDFQLIGSTGSTFLWPMVALSNIAQGSVAFAIMILMKNDKKIRGLAFTSGVSAWLGITEPAMFGVNLRYRFPFIAAIIGSAISGVVVSVSGVKAPSIGIGGLPAPLSILPENWGIFILGMLIVIVVPFVLTLLFGKVQGRNMIRKSENITTKHMLKAKKI